MTQANSNLDCDLQSNASNSDRQSNAFNDAMLPKKSRPKKKRTTTIVGDFMLGGSSIGRCENSCLRCENHSFGWIDLPCHDFSTSLLNNIDISFLLYQKRMNSFQGAGVFSLPTCFFLEAYCLSIWGSNMLKFVTNPASKYA